MLIINQLYREKFNSFIHWLLLLTGFGYSYLAFQVAVELENRTDRARKYRSPHYRGTE